MLWSRQRYAPGVPKLRTYARVKIKNAAKDLPKPLKSVILYWLAQAVKLSCCVCETVVPVGKRLPDSRQVLVTLVLSYLADLTHTYFKGTLVQILCIFHVPLCIVLEHILPAEGTPPWLVNVLLPDSKAHAFGKFSSQAICQDSSKLGPHLQ